MNRRRHILVLGVVVVALGSMRAQDNPTPSSDSQGSPQQPVAAYGQENAPPAVNDNPPLSGLDLPSLQEHAAPLSYLQPGVTVSESASTNLGNEVGGNNSSFGSISRGLGSLALRRLWSHYDLALDYMGGVAYYNRNGIGLKMLQDLGFDQKILWKRGQLSLRDTFSYLPEGNFGASYGSLGSVGVANLGNTAFGSFWQGLSLGALGLAPRIMNVSLADVSENLTPKSAITAAGGYAFTHFYGSDFNGTAFLGSSQFSGQVGYNRSLSSHTQIAAVYGYQGFDFSVAGTAFHSHIVQGMYGHRISGRMDVLLGAGPQFTKIGVACSVIDVLNSNPNCTVSSTGQPIGTVPSTRIGVAAQARLRYRLRRDIWDLRYERFETSGGGLFAGAQSDTIRLGLEHPISRVWSLSADLGYSHNDRLQPLTLQQQNACLNPIQTSKTACPANDAKTYNDGFVGAAVHRYFGRNFHGFASYQFNELSFDHSYCTSTSPCSRISNRQILTIGLDWTPRPIRID